MDLLDSRSFELNDLFIVWKERVRNITYFFYEQLQIRFIILGLKSWGRTYNNLSSILYLYLCINRPIGQTDVSLKNHLMLCQQLIHVLSVPGHFSQELVQLNVVSISFYLYCPSLAGGTNAFFTYCLGSNWSPRCH